MRKHALALQHNRRLPVTETPSGQDINCTIRDQQRRRNPRERLQDPLATHPRLLCLLCHLAQMVGARPSRMQLVDLHTPYPRGPIRSHLAHDNLIGQAQSVRWSMARIVGMTEARQVTTAVQIVLVILYVTVKHRLVIEDVLVQMDELLIAWGLHQILAIGIGIVGNTMIEQCGHRHGTFEVGPCNHRLDGIREMHVIHAMQDETQGNCETDLTPVAIPYHRHHRWNLDELHPTHHSLMSILRIDETYHPCTPIRARSESMVPPDKHRLHHLQQQRGLL
jgi:hypothetical protein